MKKLLRFVKPMALVTIVALAVLLTAVTATAASDEVYFDPSTCSAAYPNTADVELRVNATNFQSGQIELTYDTGCCNVTNFVRNTADFAMGGWDSTTDGREWITFSNVVGPLTGDYLIGTLTVQCLTDGECTTNLVIANDDSELFKDTGGELSSVNWMNGEFSCGLTTDPTLVSYTITNTTITPPQTTSIDVKFSERVSAIIKIEDASGNLVNELYNNDVTDPSAKTWGGTYTNGTTVPGGIYTVNVSGVSTTTGLSVINTSKTITVAEGLPTVSIGSAEGSVGGTVDVPISIADASNIGAMDITVTYDASILTATNVANGTMTEGLSNFTSAYDISEGELNISFATYPDTINGDGELFVVTFDAAAAGTSTLAINVTEASTGDVPSQPVTVAVEDGAVTVEEPLCPCDLNSDGYVNYDDALVIVANWGPCSGCEADLNSDGYVNYDDALVIVANWGPCP